MPQAEFGWGLIIPMLIAGSGLGLLVSQLNNYTLAPIEEQRVGEAAGVNSAAGSFGLSFGLAFAGAIMLAALLIDPVTIHHHFHARPRPDSPFRFRPSPPTPAFSLWRNQIELPPFTG